MKRGKIISLRVNENLYKEVIDKINRNTAIHAYGDFRFYCNELSGKYAFGFNGKFSIADLLEIAMKEFISTPDQM